MMNGKALVIPKSSLNPRKQAFSACSNLKVLVGKNELLGIPKSKSVV